MRASTHSAGVSNQRFGGRGLNRLEETRLRQALRKTAPSEPWVDAQFVAISDFDERGRAIVRRMHDPSVFPPGGTRTLMIRCPKCGVLMPPHAFEKGVCLDHADHEGWGPSPSALAIAALQWRNLRLTQTPLEPESISALRAEIRQHAKNSPESHYQSIENMNSND